MVFRALLGPGARTPRRYSERNKTQTAVINVAVKRMLENKVTRELKPNINDYVSSEKLY